MTGSEARRRGRGRSRPPLSSYSNRFEPEHVDLREDRGHDRPVVPRSRSRPTALGADRQVSTIWLGRRPPIVELDRPDAPGFGSWRVHHYGCPVVSPPGVSTREPPLPPEQHAPLLRGCSCPGAGGGRGFGDSKQAGDGARARAACRLVRPLFSGIAAGPPLARPRSAPRPKRSRGPRLSPVESGQPGAGAHAPHGAQAVARLVTPRWDSGRSL